MTRLLPVGILAFVLGITHATVAGQTPPRDPRPQEAGRQIPVGTAAISGVVMSIETGAPLRNAHVTLSGSAGVIPAGRGMAPPTNSTPQPPTLSISRQVTTDAQGRFSFTRLAQGRYAVSVTRDGYLQASYGQRRANAGTFPAIELADGEQRAIAMSLSRGGVIGGTIMDQYGEPAPNMQVQLWKIDSSIGVKRLLQVNSNQSNDRGAYRFFGLQAGNYLVAVYPRHNDTSEALLAEVAAIEQAVATGRVQTPAAGPAYVIVPPPAQPRGTAQYLPVYFPGTLSPMTAQAIPLAGSEERDGIDLTLAFARAATIKGTVSPPLPEGSSLSVTLVSTEALNTNTQGTSLNRDDNTFTISNVAPGRYTLLVQTRPGQQLIDGARVMVDGKPVDAGIRVSLNVTSTPATDAARRQFAQTELVVSDDTPLQVTLALRPALTVSGTVRFDMALPPALQAAQSRVQLTPVPGLQNVPNVTAPVGPDGTFTLMGVLPGRYFLRVPWTVQSATLSGQDLVELPFDVAGDRNITGVEITVTDKASEVFGTLTDAAGNPLGNRLMAIAPIDQQQWVPGSRRIATASTGPYGRYTFKMPPGDYVVGPVDDFDSGLQYDPQVLTQLATTGSRVTVTEGSTTQRDFRVR